MTGADLPLWGAWTVTVLALAGAGLSLIGTIGLVQLRTFYERVHAPTLGATLGMALVLASSVIYFTVAERR